MNKSIANSFWGVIIVLLTIVYASRAYTDVLILSPESDTAITVANQIKEKIDDKDVKIVHTLPNAPPPSLVITLGKASFKEYSKTANAHDDTLVLASFIQPNDLNALAPLTNNSLSRTSAVFPVVKSDHLLAALKKDFGSVRLGYIYIDENDPYLLALKESSKKYGVQIVDKKLQQKDIFKTYREIFKQRSIDLMLISQDSIIYSPNKLRYILEALYRENIPAIGLSKPLIGSGVIATFYISQQNIIDQTAAKANTLLKNPNAVEQLYINSYKKHIDKEFAQRLGINLDNNRHE